MKIYLGADHGGFQMKEEIKAWLVEKGYEVEDAGAHILDDDDDYVDFGMQVAQNLKKEDDRGLLFCRNGMGMVITANRFVNVRCGVGFDTQAVKRGRVDDAMNCLAIPADYLTTGEAKEMIDVFLKMEPSKEVRYVRRLEKLAKING